MQRRPGMDITYAKTTDVSSLYQLGCWNQKAMCALLTVVGLFIATS